MPIYHFNVRDGISVPDDVGMELPGLDQARSEAVRYASSLLAEQAETFWKGEEWHMDVTDNRGLILFTLTFVATNAPSVSGRGAPAS